MIAKQIQLSCFFNIHSQLCLFPILQYSPFFSPYLLFVLLPSLFFTHLDQTGVFMVHLCDCLFWRKNNLFILCLCTGTTTSPLQQPAFEIVKALELLASSRGWQWTWAIVIKSYVWPALGGLCKDMSSGQTQKAACICCCLKVLGNVIVTL